MPLFGSALFGSPGGSSSSGPSGTTPVSRLIYAASRKAGFTLNAGRGLSTDQYSDALDELNRMIGSWNCERPRIYTVQIQEFDLDGSKTYTIGQDPSGTETADFDAPRPQQIEQANLIFPTTPEIRRPLGLLTDAEWSRIVLQDIPDAPMFFLYNDGGYPFSTLYCWPQSPAGYSLELYYWLVIPTFATKDDIVTLPPGYEDAIVNNLAVRLSTFPWPTGIGMNPQVKVDALRCLAAIASKNAPPPPRRSSDAPSSGQRSGVIGDFNWMTGQRP